MGHQSIRSRFSVSLTVNLARAGLSFLTGLFVARQLGPSDYGAMTFLLGSFTSIRVLLDMGSSTAFFTFLSQGSRSRGFVFGYLAWQALQFLLLLAAVGILLPQTWIELIWLGHDKTVILAALLASFMQQQTWQTFCQIGDSMRKTHEVQLIGLAVVAAHILLVALLWLQGMLNLYMIFGLISVEYFLASLLVWTEMSPRLDSGPAPGFREQLQQYWQYCAPLIAYSCFGFLYPFAENWMLQHFGGARQQGFYAVGVQFSTISTFATISLLQIFWKEVAEAHAKGDILLVRRLYRKVSRFLYAVAAAVSGFLMPWSRELTSMTLGPQYGEGAAILALMLLYPLHQTMGQINTTLFFATARTGVQARIGIASSIIGLPISYFVLAPMDAIVPGLGLGGLGMAIKLIIFTAAVVNLVSWWFCRSHGWKFDWAYQLQSLAGATLAGTVSYLFGQWLGDLGAPLYAQFVIASVTYGAIVIALVWRFPDVVGLSRPDLAQLVRRIKQLARQNKG